MAATLDAVAQQQARPLVRSEVELPHSFWRSCRELPLSGALDDIVEAALELLDPGHTCIASEVLMESPRIPIPVGVAVSDQDSIIGDIGEQGAQACCRRCMPVAVDA